MHYLKSHLAKNGNDLTPLWPVIERLESLLENGDSASEMLIRNIIEDALDNNGVHFLKSALEDISSYDYQDAIRKVKAFKLSLVSVSLEGEAIDQ